MIFPLISFFLWPIFFLIHSYTAVSDYRQSLQFQNLNEEKQNIHMEVCFCGFMCSMIMFSLPHHTWIFSSLDLYVRTHINRLLEVAEELRYLYLTL
jgi:uncharacterized membrane protein